MDSLLVTPPSATKCTLISGLYTLTTKAGFTLAQNNTYNAWVQSIETTIVNNVALTTNKAKFQLISAEFEKFSLEQSTIWSKVQFMNISTWGAVEHVTKITNEWNMESSLSLVVASSSSGNCKLFDLLLEGCQGDTEKHTALSAFIESDLKTIVKGSATMTQTEVITAVYKAFQTKFFVSNPTWKTNFYSLNLSGYFAFSQWSEVAVSYERSVTVTTTLSGSGMDCPFILAMNKTLSMTTYTNTQKGFIKNLMNYFIQQWASVTTVEARMTLISMKFSESIDLSYSYFSVLNSIQIEGFGSWYDLIILSCQKPTMPPSCGCVVPTFAPDTTTAPMVPTTTPMIEVTTTEAMETTEMPTDFTTEATTEFSTEATSESTWDSSFSTITFASTTEGCTCSCEM
jgi:hypothetical protein